MKFISGNPYIVKKNGKIFIDSVPLDGITKKYKTPFLIFIENRIRDNIQTFTNPIIIFLTSMSVIFASDKSPQNFRQRQVMDFFFDIQFSIIRIYIKFIHPFPFTGENHWKLFFFFFSINLYK